MKDLAEKLKKYNQSDYYPFHMPGHKQHNLGNWMNYEMDITEIEGFDNLQNPTGILQAAQQRAACIYGAKKSFFLVNGSTSGILAAIRAAKNYSKEIIIGRNCHKSIYNGCDIERYTVHYIYPWMTSMGIDGGITPQQVEAAMEENQKAKVVLMTSPTYDGVVSDIGEIAKVVHTRGGILIVDCAHGAHFGMDSFFPESPVTLGADLVIMSLHKTLPSPTQTALLHLCTDKISACEVQEALNIFQTSSPSYLLMTGIQECLSYVVNKKGVLFTEFVDNLKNFYLKCEELHQIDLSKSLLDKKEIYDLDLSKILMFPKKPMDGPGLNRKLMDEYHLQMEMVSPDSVLALTSCMDTKEGLIRLERALLDMDNKNNENIAEDQIMKIIDSFIKPQKAMEIWEAREKEEEILPIQDCINRISKSYLYLYPPGIPVLAPGEEITKKLMEWIHKIRGMGLNFEGGLDDRNLVIKVVK